MMKKLLILVLALGMASTVSAAVRLHINGSEPGASVGLESGTTIQMHSDTAGATWDGYVFIAEGGSGSLTNGRLGPASPGDQGGIMGPVTYTGFGVGYQMQADYLDTSTPPQAGYQFLIDLIGNLDDTGTVTLNLGPNYTASQSFDYTIIPEPMTIALLGLGGLLLRRRK